MFYGKLCDVVDKIKRLDRKEEPKPSSRNAAEIIVIPVRQER